MAIAYLKATYDHKFDIKPSSLLRDPDRKHYPCKPRTWGTEFISPINDLILEQQTPSNEAVVEKHTFNGFFKTALCEFLWARQIQTILIAVETHVCVLATAQGASFNQFGKIIILKNCVWAAKDNLAQCALEIFRDGFGDTMQSSQIFSD